MRILSGRPVRLVGMAVALVSTLGLAACSADQTDLQNKIKTGLNGEDNADAAKLAQFGHANSVSCPSSVQLKDGTKFQCTVQGTDTSGAAATFTVSGHIVGSNKFTLDNIEKSGGAGTPSTPSTPATTTT